MRFSAFLRGCALLTAGFVAALQGQTVLVLPGNAGTDQTVPYANDLSAAGNAVQTGTPGLTAFTGPTNGRTYVVARSTTNTIAVFPPGSAFATVRLNLPAPAEAAALRPNGTGLVVLAGALYQFEFQTDTPQAAVPVGVNPTDLAFSRDGSRAFVLSAQSGTITAVNLASNAVAATVPVPVANATGLFVSPLGAVYVTGAGSLVELSADTLATRGTITATGTPDELVFSVDGQRAYAVNRATGSGPSLLQFNLATRAQEAAATQTNGTVAPLDAIYLTINPNLAYAYSRQEQALYEVTLSPLALRLAQLAALPNAGPVIGATVSDEVNPGGRYLYIAFPNGLVRLDLGGATPVLAGSTTFAAAQTGVNLAYTAAPSFNPPTTLLVYNTFQDVVAGNTTLPLLVRAVDGNRRPVPNALLSFRSDQVGFSLSQTATTDAYGYAAITFQAPATPGTLQVNVSLPNGFLTRQFTVNVLQGSVGGGPGPVTPGGNDQFRAVFGNGQVVVETERTRQPLTVQAIDSNRRPQAGLAVTFTLQGTGQLQQGPEGACSVSQNVATCTTDTNGLASLYYFGPNLVSGRAFEQFSIVASSTLGSLNFAVTTILGADPVPPAGFPFGTPRASITYTFDRPYAYPSPSGTQSVDLRGAAGTVLPAAFRVRALLNAPGYAENGTVLPNVGLFVGINGSDAAGATAGAAAACAGGVALSDATGVATCDLQLGSVPGFANLYAIAGGQDAIGSIPNVLFAPQTGVRGAPISLTITGVTVSRVEVVSGNAQQQTVGLLVQQRLVARVLGANNQVLANVPVTFTINPAANASLRNQSTATDANGLASTDVVLGSTPGPVQVTVTAGTQTATFTLTALPPAPAVTPQSVTVAAGTPQTATVGDPFAQALTVTVIGSNGLPLAGQTVTFTPSGGIGLSTTSAVTNTNGQASVAATAAATPGTGVVTATVAGLTPVSFALTSTARTLPLTAGSFTNAATGRPGLSPGALAIISAPGIAGGTAGTLTASVLPLGPLPTQLGPVRVLFNGVAAPIQSVSNVNGVEQVIVQVPFETPVGAVSVDVIVNGVTSPVLNVPVQQFSPGIFDYAEGAVRRAVLIKEDGSLVSAANPAVRGERIRMFATGLGQATPALGTDRLPAEDRRVANDVVVGINNAGVRVISAEYTSTTIGVVEVVFEVPADAPQRDEVVLALGVVAPGGSTITYGGDSRINIR